MIYVTLVYGPIAAWLVELFPTRIRYSGLSLPYHIGNGWFGGFLPATVFAIVAATGNIYSGLWYPIVVAAMSFVVGLIFLPETKDATSRKSDDYEGRRGAAIMAAPHFISLRLSGLRPDQPSRDEIAQGRCDGAQQRKAERRTDDFRNVRQPALAAARHEWSCNGLTS